MNSPFRLGLMAVLLSTHFSVNAQEPLPNAFLYNDKPIDARCFAMHEGAERTVSLATCGLGTELDITHVAVNKKLLREGFIGYNFKVVNAGPTQGYSYYRLITPLANQYLLLTLNSDGGSGSFTALQTMQRKGDNLTLTTLNTGDRCNGGLSQVKVLGDNVQYHVNITPFDFLTLANDNPGHLKAYEDLASCAACCVGTVLRTRPLNHISKESTISIDFGQYEATDTSNPETTTYQKCFNQLIADYQQKHQTVLSLNELKTLVHVFNQKCVRG